MKISNDILAEILTDDGHNGIIRYSSECINLERRKGTIEILKNMHAKNIIHIGCCGHLQNIDQQIKSGIHFHVMLRDMANKVIGFDINEEAISRLSSYGVSDIYAKDILEDHDEISQIIKKSFGDEPFVILLPEVLEHIPNPVAFLTGISNYYGKQENRIVISVPSSLGFGRVCNALFHNSENINMDHKYMFTPTTILKVMSISGITPTDLEFFDLYKYSRIFKKPILGNTILTVGNFNK